MFAKFFDKLFSVDSVGYCVLSSLACTGLLWGLYKFAAWLYYFVPFWIKLPIALLFTYTLYKQLRINQAEQNRMDNEDPSE